MKITRQEREHLDKLSKEVFGTSSKWYKLFLAGELVPKKITLKSGREINGQTYSYPTIEQMKQVLELKAKDIAEKNKAKEET